jgi:hypothetical protein
MKMSFSAAVAAFGKESLVKVDKVRRASALEVFSLVIDGSPVDTGLLRGNWQTAINSPRLSRIERLDPTGSTAKAEALANLGSMVDVVIMTNSLPYVERIEYEGYSAQAPDGMVRKAAAKWQRIVEAKAKAILAQP